MLEVSDTCSIVEFSITKSIFEKLKFKEPDNSQAIPPLLYIPYTEDQIMYRVTILNFSEIEFKDIDYYGDETNLISITASNILINRVTFTDINNDSKNVSEDDPKFLGLPLAPLKIEILNPHSFEVIKEDETIFPKVSINEVTVKSTYGSNGGFIHFVENTS